MTFPSIHDPAHLYFVTATIIEWKHLFTISEYVNIPLDSLSWMQANKRMLLFAFVIMPSHLHMVIKPEGESVGDLLQQFGSYTAHQILKKLKTDNKTELLKTFHQHRRDERHEHSIWQDIQSKNIFSIDFLNQKIQYIHQNPIAKKWNLAKNRSDYLYSSAGYYDLGRKPVIEITDINEWLTSVPSPRTAKEA